MVLDFYLRNFDEFALYEPLPIQAKSLGYHKASLAYEYKAFQNGELMRLHLFEKRNPMTIIGTVSYRSIQRSFYDSCLLGYKMDKNFRRMGYCREAIRAGNAIMFNHFGLHRIEATILPDNVPSMNLLSSIGFQNEGLLRGKIKLQGEWKDHFLFALLDSDVQSTG